MHMLDALRAGFMPVATEAPPRFWSALAGRLKSRLNRSAVVRLDSFSDHELADIGLTRLDVRSALDDSRFFEDPSRKLAHSVRGRRHS